MPSLLEDLLDLLPEFEFVPSLTKGDWEDQAPITETTDVTPREGETVTRFALDGDSPVDMRGEKQSQRAEVKESRDSDDANQAGETLWYALSVQVAPETGLPAMDGGLPAKLSLVQFHQRDGDGASDKPAIMVYLQGDGTLLVQFESAVGKRAYSLGEADVRGEWIDLAIGAHWGEDGAWTEVWMRREYDEGYTRMLRDEGMNTSTGSLYVKYGVYRSFLERDPSLAEAEAVAYFDAVSRADSFDALSLPEPVLPDFAPMTLFSPLDSFVFDLG